jgi:hypothetical protein
MHIAFNIFAFVLVLAFGWMLFVVWLFGVIFRGIWRGFSGLFGTTSPSRPRTVGSDARRCPGYRCGAANPLSANFCRRCGSPMNYPLPRTQPRNSTATGRWASSPISL